MHKSELYFRTRLVTVISLCLGWGVAWGAAAAYPDMLALPWVQIAIGALIAAWGGATATLGRYLTAAYDSRPFLWKPEVVRDLVVSIAVGAGGYLAGWSYELSPPMVGLLLLLCGYGGTRVLSAAVERLLSSLAQRNEKL